MNRSNVSIDKALKRIDLLVLLVLLLLFWCGSFRISKIEKMSSEFGFSNDDDDDDARCNIVAEFINFVFIIELNKELNESSDAFNELLFWVILNIVCFFLS